MSPNDSVWQGVLLGLGDDGTTYHCQGDTWQPYIPPLNPQDKAAELTAVTEQRDRLAEAMRKIQKVGLVAVDAFDELDRIDEIVDEALAAVKGGADE